MKRVWLLVLFLFLLIACKGQAPVGDVSEDRTTLQNNLLFQHFVRSYPGRDVLKWALKDMDNDGKEDLILIYRIEKEKNAMRVILNSDGTYAITNDVPAPVANQAITFKDIDEKPPMEFIVQGMKGTKIGYAVYRVEKGKLVDLFGEGMDECC